MSAVIWSGIVMAGLATAGVFAAPKSHPDKLYYMDHWDIGIFGLIGCSVIQVSVVLTIACCWLLWAITYMAQLNPLIQPHPFQGE